MSVRFIDQDGLEYAARSFLQEHHPSLALPVPIEEIIDIRLGIDIVPIPGLQCAFDVDGFITSDLRTICADEFV